MDTAYKPTLRGSRKSVKELFFAFVDRHQSRFSQNRYRWSDEKLKNALTSFMQEFKTAEGESMGPFTEQEIWTIGLLVFPNKGNYCKNKIACKPLYESLKEDGIRRFRDLFGENTTSQVEEFFQSDLIQKIWPIIRENLRMDHCFENKNKGV